MNRNLIKAEYRKRLETKLGKKSLLLTGEELQHGGRHGDGCRDVGELDNQGREELDHDVRHLHRAHGQGHHTLLGTAVNETGLKALNQLPLQTGESVISVSFPRQANSLEILSLWACGGPGVLLNTATQTPNAWGWVDADERQVFVTCLGCSRYLW